MRIRIGLLLAVLTVGLALFASTGVASASTTGHRLGPEYFTVFESTYDQAGTVNAYGPVHGRNGTLGSNNAGTVAYFQFRRGTVYVAHPPTPSTPTINWQTCTATTTQTGPWKMTGGTGKYWGAFGWGQFTLQEIAVFQIVNGQCTASPTATPVYFQLNVTGSGVAGLP